jgi:hypothetical protein
MTSEKRKRKQRKERKWKEIKKGKKMKRNKEENFFLRHLVILSFFHDHSYIMIIHIS